MRNILKKILFPAPGLKISLSTSEHDKLISLAATLGNKVIFDSRRSNYFGIYELNLQSVVTSALIQDQSAHLIYPDVCSKNGAIVYAKCTSLDRNALAEIWIHDGQVQTKLADMATFPTFSSDGKRVYFERQRQELWYVDLVNQKEVFLFAGKQTEFGNYAVVKPRVSPDNEHVIFTSDKGGRWNLWCVNLKTFNFHHVVKGCEAAWFPDSQNTAWIRKYGSLDFVGIYGSNAIKPDAQVCLQDSKTDLGHEYFPFITEDGKFLLYSACPIYQHDHNTAQYQLFAKNLASGEVTRLTYDKYTNRWPKLLPVSTSA